MFSLFLLQLSVICKKEILAIWQNPATRIIVLLPCVVMGFLFGYAANYNLEEAPYALVDLSHTRASSDLAASFDGTGFFKRAATLSNVNEVGNLMDRGDIIMAVTIPEDFDKKLAAGEASPVQVLVDGRNTVTAQQALSYAGRIINAYNQQELGAASAIHLVPRTWFNPNQITRWFFLPGIIGLLSFAQVFLLAGLSVAREREEGTFEQLLVAPVAPTVILIGKAVPPLLAGFFQCTVLFLISRLWFGVPFAGSIVTFYVALFFYLLSSTGLGLVVSSISKNMKQVLVYVIVIMVPMALLSGIITPVKNMPAFLQYVTYADPLRFGLELIRRIYLEGLSFTQLFCNFVPLTGISLVSLSLAGYLFRHHMN